MHQQVLVLSDVQPKQSPARRRVVTLGGPGQKAKKGHTAEEHNIKFKNNRSGKILAGTLVEGSEKRAVVLCHGFASYRDGFHFPAIAQHLATRNIGSLRFDFAGNGESEGTFQFGNYPEEAEDIRAAVEHLRSKGCTVVGIVGHSKGANSALLYAAKYDDVPNVVNIAGRFDLTRGLTERFGNDIVARLSNEKQLTLEDTRDDGFTFEWTLTKWSYQDRLNTDMKATAAKIRCTEVLTLHGTKDRVTPVEDAKRWGSHIAHHRLKVVDGADHTFLMPCFSEQVLKAVAEQFAL